VNRVPLGFQFFNQDVEALNAAFVASPSAQAPIVFDFHVDLLALPTHRSLQHP
jgi:hypothetical protein